MPSHCSLAPFLCHSVDDFFALYDVSVVAPTGLRKRRTIVVDRLNRMVYRCASRKAARQLVNNSTLLADEAQAQEAALRAAALSSSGMVSSPDSASAETGKVGCGVACQRRALAYILTLCVCHMQQGKKRAKGKFVARKIDHDTTVLAHNTDLKRIKLLFEGTWYSIALHSHPSAHLAMHLHPAGKSKASSWRGSDLVFASPDARETFAGQIRAFVQEASSKRSNPADSLIRLG